MNDQSGVFWAYMIPLLLVVLVMRRNLRGRRLRVERLWILPVVLALIGVLTLVAKPPTTATAIAALAGALALGAAAGWYRGRLTRITVDPGTHDLTSKASVLGVVLIVVVMAARNGLRFYLESHAVSGPLAAYAPIATDALLMFSVAMLGVQRLEMWQRARRLLAEAIAA